MREPYENTFGHAMFQERLEREVTLRELGLRTGIQPSRLSAIENGSSPSGNEVIAIASVLHMDIAMISEPGYDEPEKTFWDRCRSVFSPRKKFEATKARFREACRLYRSGMADNSLKRLAREVPAEVAVPALLELCARLKAECEYLEEGPGRSRKVPPPPTFAAKTFGTGLEKKEG